MKARKTLTNTLVITLVFVFVNKMITASISKYSNIF